MAEKKERDWSEIIEEVRVKAKSEIDDLLTEIKPRVQSLVTKVREANFREEAEELLKNIRGIADDLTDRTNKMPGDDAQKTSQDPPLYIEPDGTERWRKGKWSQKYSQKEMDKMKQR